MTMKRKPEPEKYCLSCGKRMHRKQYKNSAEYHCMFLRRKYCNLECAYRASLKKSAGWSALHKRAKKFMRSKCDECGGTHYLGVHHKDMNPANNSPENLLTLCASCHTKLHWREGKRTWKERAKCVVCGEPAKGHKMCQKHYQRWKKHGDPHLVKRPYNELVRVQD